MTYVPELLPCHHCGGPARTRQERDRRIWFVQCDDCDARIGGHIQHDTESAKPNAIAAWNRRDPAIATLRAQLAEAESENAIFNTANIGLAKALTRVEAQLATARTDALRIETLFDAIKHGDEVHRAWLRQAIDDHFSGRPVVNPVGRGTTETVADALQAAATKVVYWLGTEKAEPICDDILALIPQPSATHTAERAVIEAAKELSEAYGGAEGMKFSPRWPLWDNFHAAIEALQTAQATGKEG